MALRADALDPREFTRLFFTVMNESQQDESFGEGRLYGWCMERFDNDRRKTDSFIHRFLGLIDLMDRPEAEPWLLQLDDQMKLHPALLETAATLRTRKNGSFPDRRFFDEVNAIAESLYADFSFDEAP